MKIENQVCTLAQAKRLKELGVKQESYFSWFGEERMRLVDNAKDGVAYSNWLFIAATEPANNQDVDWREDVSLKQIASAFTVAELGMLLPDYINIGCYRMHFRSYKQEQNNGGVLWTVTYGKSEDKEVPDFDNTTEASARAAMLIHLLENKIVHP